MLRPASSTITQLFRVKVSLGVKVQGYFGAPFQFPGNAYKRRPCEYNVPYRCPRSQSSQESVNFVHSFSYQHLRPDDGHVVNSEEDDIL